MKPIRFTGKVKDLRKYLEELEWWNGQCVVQ